MLIFHFYYTTVIVLLPPTLFLAVTSSLILCTSNNIDCKIDGEALKELVDDFDEFSALVTAPLSRLRMVRELCNPDLLETQQKEVRLS